jgi:arginyl-tRNA synthetase
MKQQLTDVIKQVVVDLYGLNVDIELTRPDEQFGDYTTNVALQLSKKLSKSPREIAEAIAAKLTNQNSELIEGVSVAGLGFINLKLTIKALLQLVDTSPAKLLENQVVVTEYGDPNPFKILHAGHLYTAIVGDAIANLLEQAGAEVHRVNFGGDIGMHVAKSIWSIIRSLNGENPDGLDSIEQDKRSEWLSGCYVEGNQAYEDDENAKQEIMEYNRRLYEIINNSDHDSALAQIYWTCRQWSYDYFDYFYNRIGVNFEKYYPESEILDISLQTVRQNIPNVYQESEGAIIFDGDKYGLYANVFINSQGQPTYAAKDVGLVFKKWEDYHFSKSIIITGADQQDYLKVVYKSIEQYRPDLTKDSTHLTHGIIKMAGGVKMSSRLGNILKATDMLDAASEANKARGDEEDVRVTVGAVKYALLKQRIGGDIIYDPTESVSIEGNSGPYLQYAHARAKNIVSKAGQNESGFDLSTATDFNEDERSLLRKISEYAEVIDQATLELKPHHICTYIYELAQNFNRFYEHNRVIDDPRQQLRLKLVGLYSDRLSKGLMLIGIAAPDKM